LMESWLFCSLNTCKGKVLSLRLCYPLPHLQPLAHPQVITQIVKQILIQVEIHHCQVQQSRGRQAAHLAIIKMGKLDNTK
jgi:hypothetical protein